MESMESFANALSQGDTSQSQLTELAERVYRATSSQREEILTAFIAKYGAEPDEIMQITQNTLEGTKWYVRLMTEEERKLRDAQMGK